MTKYYAQYNHGRITIRKWRSDHEYERECYYTAMPTTPLYEATNIEIARIIAHQLLSWAINKETAR
jgi:hypothetical protein